MLDFMRKNKGSISIFLCIIMLPMITYCSMIIDSSRLQASRTQLQCAGDLTMNAAMSEYEKVLEDMYGLFAVSEDPEKLKPALENYFYETISGSINSSEEEDEYVRNFSRELADTIFSSNVKEDDISNFLYMKLEDFTYEPVPESRVSNPMVMKSQIIDYMKYKGPISIASNLLNKLGALKDSANQADAAKKKIEYTQEVSKLDEPMKKAWESIDKYNKIEEKFRTKEFDKPEKIRDMLTQMAEKSKTLAGNIKLGNTFRSYYAKQVGGSSSGDAYNDIDSGYESLFSTGEIDSQTDWKDRMDLIGSLLADRLVKPEAGELSGFEKAYGDITVAYGSDGSVISLGIGSLAAGSSPDRPVYGNLKKWNAELSSAAAVPSDTLLTAYYDAQTGHLKKIGSIAEYKAYIEYVEFLNKEYSDLYNAHTDEINALDNAEQTEYKKVRNTLSKLEAELRKSETYTEYRSFLKKLGDETPYSTHSPKDINTEFKEYYGYVKEMEQLSADIDKSLGDILTQLDKVESKGNEWNDQIGKVEDDGVRSQMQSDHKTSTNSIKRDDINSLRKVVEDINAQLKGLRGEIEGVSFLDEKMCTSNSFTYSGLKDSSYLKAADVTGAPPSGTEIVNGLPGFKSEPLAKDLGTSSEQLSENIRQLEGLDGKDKYGSERKEEAFYNTLYNSYGVTARGLSSEENSKVDKINDAAQVDDEGKPTGVDKDADKDKDKEKEKKENAGDEDEVKKAYDKIVELNVPAEDTEEYGRAEGSSVSKDKDSDYSKSADSGGDSLSSASKFLRLIENIAEEIRDDVYLEEYFTEMFTCQTDKKLDQGKLKLINGYSNIPAAAGHYKPINMDNEWYGKEMEYILWGSSDLDKNLRSNETVIFLIRFALNAIYAFTAADIQSFANSVATALVGWTVVLVPVVSVCITLALALAESAYDLYELKEGRDVPIFKDAHTFVCSPTGALTKVATEIIKEAAEKATNYIEDEVDKLIDKGAEEAGKTIAEARDTVQDVCNKYAEKLTDSIKSSVKDQFVTPIMNSITPIVNGLNSSFSNADELVDEKVDSAFDSISESINNMQDGATKELTLLFLTRYGDEVRSSVKEQLKDYINDIGIKGLKISDISMDEIQKKVNDFVDDKIEAVDGFAKDIKNKVKELTDDMYDEIMSHGNELVSNLKGYVHEQIGEISSQITGNITNAISSSVSNAVSEGIDRSASGGLTLNYKEYCKIFMFIKLLSDSGEKNALLRAAALIQANVRYAVKDPDTNPIGGNKDFVISESYSIIYIGAKARMTTIFPWGVTVDDDGTGSADASFDLSNVGDNSIVINFSGINGF